MSPHDQVEIEALRDLEQLAVGSTVADFVTNLEARASGLSIADDESGVELSTIHGAKGREWDTVVLFGANADQMPHFRTLAEAGSEGGFADALEDERRLAYVAITRSRDRLVIVSTGEPSPFLGESGLVPLAPSAPTKTEIDARAAEVSDPVNEASAKRQMPAKVGVQGLPSSSSLPTIRAKYQGHCAACGGAISPGETIVNTGGAGFISDVWPDRPPQSLLWSACFAEHTRSKQPSVDRADYWSKSLAPVPAMLTVPRK
jgi:hypothetical protein